MKALSSSLIITITLMLLAAQEVRPVKDDVGFCWNEASMKTLDIKITPIMVAPMPSARMEEVSTKLAAVVAAYMKENRLAVRKTIALDSGKKINGTLFRYSDTYSEGALPLTKPGMGTTAPFSLRHWVSFCSIGYYLE